MPGIAASGAVQERAGSEARTSHRRSRARWSLPLTILTLTLAFAGCGSSDNGVASKSGPEILAATRAAAQSASAVHITATNSVANGKITATLDLSLAKSQGRARSSFLGTTYETIRIGDTLYIKGNQAFATQLGHVQGVKVPPGVWLKGSTNGRFAQLAPIASLKTEVPLMLSGSGTVTKGPITMIKGKPAITLKLARKLYTGTLYIATTGKPYPLKLTKTGRETGQTTFANWNAPVTVSPPANAIEITKLQPQKGH